MTEQPTPTILSDAQLLAWVVILEHRRQSQKHGINTLLLPFPPCPTCGEHVREVQASYDYEQPIGQGGYRIATAPCGHNHTADETAMERIYEHGRQVLDGIESDGRQGRGPHTDDIIKEAAVRVGEPDEPHVCRPGVTTYYCPTAGEIESDCHGGFDVCCARTDLHQQILRCNHAHCGQAHGPHSWEPQPGMTPVYCEGFDAPTVNPPGFTQEQLPADILALLTPRTYLSTACETARLLDGAIIRNPGRDDLPKLRDRMHGRCRLNHKFTGATCSCHCHPEEKP